MIPTRWSLSLYLQNIPITIGSALLLLIITNKFSNTGTIKSSISCNYFSYYRRFVILRWIWVLLWPRLSRRWAENFPKIWPSDHLIREIQFPCFNSYKTTNYGSLKSAGSSLLYLDFLSLFSSFSQDQSVLRFSLLYRGKFYVATYISSPQSISLVKDLESEGSPTLSIQCELLREI